MCVRSTLPGSCAARRVSLTTTSQPRPMVCCAVFALVCAALAHAHADRPRRAEISPVPFVMGSRYGRSSERIMMPRNDRFIMGSRYGKRSGAEEEPSPVDAREVWEGCEKGAQVPCRLLCRYTGVPQLYKCMQSQEHPQYISRSDADTRARGGD